MFFGLSVVMTESYVHSVVKMLLAVPQVLRHCETNHEKLFRDDSKNEALKKAVSRFENQSSILKKSFAVQIKVRKVATKLQNVSPNAGSLLRCYITQFFIGTQAYI